MNALGCQRMKWINICVESTSITLVTYLQRHHCQTRPPKHTSDLMLAFVFHTLYCTCTLSSMYVHMRVMHQKVSNNYRINFHCAQCKYYCTGTGIATCYIAISYMTSRAIWGNIFFTYYAFEQFPKILPHSFRYSCSKKLRNELESAYACAIQVQGMLYCSIRDDSKQSSRVYCLVAHSQIHIPRQLKKAEVRSKNFLSSISPISYEELVKH